MYSCVLILAWTYTQIVSIHDRSQVGAEQLPSHQRVVATLSMSIATSICMADIIRQVRVFCTCVFLCVCVCECVCVQVCVSECVCACLCVYETCVCFCLCAHIVLRMFSCVAERKLLREPSGPTIRPDSSGLRAQIRQVAWALCYLTATSPFPWSMLMMATPLACKLCAVLHAPMHFRQGWPELYI